MAAQNKTNVKTGINGKKYTKNKSTNKKIVKISRSESSKIVACVSGGLAHYFNIDPTLIRLIFIFLTLFGGSGVLIYLMLWIIIPTESNTTKSMDENLRLNTNDLRNSANKLANNFRNNIPGEISHAVVGIIIIAFGLVVLLGNL